MPVRKNQVPVKVHNADSLPNGGNTPLKRVNKRKHVTGSSKSFKRLEQRRKDFDAMKSSHSGEMKQRHAIDNGGFHRPGSNKK